MRGVGSSESDPYCAAAAAIGALYGPLHGGANEAVLRMLEEIGSKDKVPAFVKDVKERAGTCVSWASGTASTRTTTRARRSSRRWPTRCSRSPAATRCSTSRSSSSGSPSQDDYFVKRKLYPNVDFYSGLIYQAMKFPIDMFPVLFAIPRMSGWLAQWQEMIEDKDQKIARPRQIFLGPGKREYVPLHRRG